MPGEARGARYLLYADGENSGGHEGLLKRMKRGHLLRSFGGSKRPCHEMTTQTWTRLLLGFTPPGP